MQRSLDRFSPKNIKAGRIHRSITTWDRFSPQNTKVGRMQRSLDRFSPENPRPVGYINHQQQPTTIIFHMINQQVSLENRNWKKKKKKKFAGASPKNAELQRSFKTSKKHTEQAGST
jgi:hypothetical protein